MWAPPHAVSYRAAQYACALAGDTLRRNGASAGVLASVRQLEAHLSLGRKREWGCPGAGGGGRGPSFIPSFSSASVTIRLSRSDAPG